MGLSGLKDSGSSAFAYPHFEHCLPNPGPDAGRYRVEFVRDAAALDAVLRMRFHVFNLELGEGLEESFLTGRDEDLFDRAYHHLAVREQKTGEVVGTYRLQTSEMAATSEPGFYSDGEFVLADLPASVTRDAIEVGRACVAREHRNGRVLYLLWKGLASYVAHNRKRYLFGCCSLPTQDPRLAARAMREFETMGALHPEIHVRPQPRVACPLIDAPSPRAECLELPPLFRIYLRHGAKICGPPVIDRRFKTIDFFVLFDVERMAPAQVRAFFGEAAPSS